MASGLTAPFLSTDHRLFLPSWRAGRSVTTIKHTHRGGLHLESRQNPSLPCPASLHSAHPGRCSKRSHSPHQTSLTRSKCSSLSLAEAASGYKAAFSELELLRQNRDQWPFHLPWLIFSAVVEMKVLRALKDSKVFTSFFCEPSVFPLAF